MADRPSDLKFTKTHEWVRIDGETATVGITDFAVQHLGDLVFVDLPEAGRVLESGETCAEVESVKAVGEVMTPVGGEVIESNDDLADDQADLASDPYGAGWLFKVKFGGDEAEGLMNLADYEKQLESEATEG